MAEELRAASRRTFSLNDPIPTQNELKVGALQRIADAVEVMARRYNDLLSDKQSAEESRDYWRKRAEKLERQVNAYKGTVTRMKKGVSHGNAR